MTFEEELKQKGVLFETEMQAYIKKSNLQTQDIIVDAMMYSLNAGGKRLRPILLLEMCLAYGGRYEEAIGFAVALEMIHTYSLIHDDLPAMDNDTLRRGKPTNHIAFGEDIAILAGDALLTCAFDIMTTAIIQSDNKLRMLNAMNTIVKSIGIKGMILGQVADIKLQSDAIDCDTLDYINHYKTGALITASLVAGAELGAAKASEIEKLRTVGNDLGLVFQIIDDLLDLIGNAQQLGKHPNQDIKNMKVTYPLLIGVSETEKRIQKLYQSLEKNIENLEIESEFLKSIVIFVIQREY